MAPKLNSLKSKFVLPFLIHIGQVGFYESPQCYVFICGSSVTTWSNTYTKCHHFFDPYWSDGLLWELWCYVYICGSDHLINSTLNDYAKYIMAVKENS